MRLKLNYKFNLITEKILNWYEKDLREISDGFFNKKRMTQNDAE